MQHVLGTGNRETRKVPGKEDGKSGRVPKLISPRFLSGNLFHFTVSFSAYLAYPASPASSAGVFCSEQFITKLLIFVPSIHHGVLDMRSCCCTLRSRFFSCHLLTICFVSTFEHLLRYCFLFLCVLIFAGLCDVAGHFVVVQSYHVQVSCWSDLILSKVPSSCPRCP